MDGPLGIDGSLTRQARRMVTFAGGQQSFARAEAALRELCGWSVSDETARLACYDEAVRIDRWLDTDERAYEGFLKAAGEVELQIDAAKVNTLGGWRDMKIGAYAKRPPGEPATPERWAERDLPGPAARVAFARVEEAEGFGRRVGDWASRLGVGGPEVSVLGDGAEWIWNLSEAHVPGARHCLDIYHASEHLSDAAKAVFGDGAGAAGDWLGAARGRLLADGWWGLCEQVGQTLDEYGEAAREAMEDLLGYFSKHTERLGYCGRLYAGRSIGSGLIEGAAKNLVGKRLKQTAARWRLENVQKMAVLCSCTYSDAWAAYWNAA